MGVKKPAVIAKTARKVRISTSEAAFAKSQGMSLEDLAKSKLPKRGRPVGSKNKPKTVSSEGWVPSTPFPNDKQLATDWEKLAKRLQEALAAQIKEADAYKKLWEEFQDKIVISQSVPIWRRIRFVFTGTI